jgi:hypothetical protein
MANQRLNYGEVYNFIFHDYEFRVISTGMRGGRNMLLYLIANQQKKKYYEISVGSFNLIDGEDIAPLDEKDVRIGRLQENTADAGLSSKLEVVQ